MIRSSFAGRGTPSTCGRGREDGLDTKRPSLRSNLGVAPVRRNDNPPRANVGWMTLHPSTNVLWAAGHNPYPRWKTLRGFPPYGRVTEPRYQP